MYLMVIERDGVVSTLWNSCEFPRQHRALRAIRGPDYLILDDQVVCL